MLNIKRVFVSAIISACVCAGAHAADLSGTVPVNVTSDTATTAKNTAMDNARRQIIVQVLSQFAPVNQVRAAVSGSKPGELMDLIESSSIDGEQVSDTTYSANITMVIDQNAAQRWMAAKNIQTTFQDNKATTEGLITVHATMSDKMYNWINLKQIARAENVDMKTTYMRGNQIVFQIPVSARTSFINALAASGWRYSAQDGTLNISK